MWDLLCPHEPTTCADLNAFQSRLLTLAEQRCRPRLYVNLPSTDPPPTLAKLADRYFYDGNREELEAAKALWDPTNLFHTTHGITPPKRPAGGWPWAGWL